ncbi:hypothetical protein D3C72_547710 [compost metagenome]
MSRVISFLTIAFMWCSCSGRAKRPDEYLRFFSNENPVNKQIQVGDLYYDISFLPAEYMAASYAMDGSNLDRQKYQEKLGIIQHVLYYSISMYSKGENPMKYRLYSQDELQGRISYYNNIAQQDIKLIVNQHDTLHPVDYIFENNLGVSNENKIIVVFNKPEVFEELTLVFNDKALDNYHLKSTVTSSKIKQLPTLKY